MGASSRSRDLRWLFGGNAARMFGYGILDVMFALYLVEMGLDTLHVGVVISATLLGSAALNFLVPRLTLRYGRRGTLLLLSTIMAASAVLILTTSSWLLLILAGASGTLNFTGATNTGFGAVDQTVLAEITDANSRNRYFGRYSTVALLARMLGALASSIPAQLQRLIGLPLLQGYRALLLLFLLLTIVGFLFSWRLSGAIEGSRKADPARTPWHNLRQSQSFIGKLSLLFGVDALATGFIPQSLIVLWFSLRFGAGAELMGPVYSGIRLLQAGAYPVAMRLADRYGLLNTVVFSHLPSQFLLLAIPFTPSLTVAVALLMAQQAMSHMDIPTRQAYIVAVVQPDERTAAVGLTNTVRNLTQGISPSISGLAIRTLSLGMPFFFAGGIGALYDVMMYFSFRRSGKPRAEPGIQDAREESKSAPNP
jgi:MFS family permease